MAQMWRGFSGGFGPNQATRVPGGGAGHVADIRSVLAGRAANGLFGSPADTGATSDLAEATRLLAAARLSFGLTDSLVYRAGPDQALDLVSRDRGLADAIRHELNRLMISTKRIVAGSRAVIERVADALLDRCVLDEAELANLIASKPTPKHQPRLDRRPDRPRSGE